MSGENKSTRRSFIKTSTAFATGLSSVVLVPTAGLAMYDNAENINIIGPRQGFSPQIGILVSMMDWMRSTVLASVNGMNVDQLDYVHDKKANTIGALLLHLAALDKYYQLNTFEGKKWGSWNDAIKKKWDVPINLGEEARKTIKGNHLNYYLDILKAIREKTITEFKKRDDKWLMTVDKDWSWGPTNNYCKWFHVCEHESNHNGQIKWIKSRLPG
jgi:uncharacterized damage-inducible protein DinB